MEGMIDDQLAKREGGPSYIDLFTYLMSIYGSARQKDIRDSGYESSFQVSHAAP